MSHGATFIFLSTHSHSARQFNVQRIVACPSFLLYVKLSLIKQACRGCLLLLYRCQGHQPGPQTKYLKPHHGKPFIVGCSGTALIDGAQRLSVVFFRKKKPRDVARLRQLFGNENTINANRKLPFLTSTRQTYLLKNDRSSERVVVSQ